MEKTKIEPPPGKSDHTTDGSIMVVQNCSRSSPNRLSLVVSSIQILFKIHAYMKRAIHTIENLVERSINITHAKLMSH